MRAIGKSVLRTEGPDKLCGATRYTDDIEPEGCLHGVTLRATIPYGRILAIEKDPAFPWREFVVATAKDLPGPNRVQLIEDDQPLLCEEWVRHPYEPILLVAHANRSRAYEALRHIRVTYEPHEPVLSIDDALAVKQKLRGEDNVFKSFHIVQGDIDAGFAAADLVVSGEYTVPHQEQAYIENNVMTAWFEADGTLVAHGSMQCPYYVHKALRGLFKLKGEKVRVIQAPTGGGFGGKEEYPNMIAGHAALLARKAKRPVKIAYDRHEDMAATTKRHPARIRHRTGVKRDGTLVAQDIEVVMDGGAYITLSPVVLSRGTLHATGPYACPNVRIRSSVVATNTVPNGAFRGFGAPQTLFAAELHMARIAAELRLDPVALREKNAVRRGSVMATGQVLRESVGARQALQRVVADSGYRRKRVEHARWNAQPGTAHWKGVGLALVHHGSGFTGSGEEHLASRAAVTLTRTGRIRVLAGSTEFGQGTNTMFSQIVAETLGVATALVDVATPDTRFVPDSGPTVASRTCMVVGRLVRDACRDLHAAVSGRKPFPRSARDLRAAAKRVCGTRDEVRFERQYEKPAAITWDDTTYRGDAYEAYGYAAAVVDLEVDKLTFEVTLRRVTLAADIGRVVNPVLAAGQVIGGAAQGLGYALLENPVYKDGAMQNAQLTNYIIPTAKDLPQIDVAFTPALYSLGPYGAKGVGELPMDIPGPAVADAVHDATGLWITSLPVLPEKIAAAHGARRRGTAVPA